MGLDLPSETTYAHAGGVDDRKPGVRLAAGVTSGVFGTGKGLSLPDADGADGGRSRIAPGARAGEAGIPERCSGELFNKVNLVSFVANPVIRTNRLKTIFYIS